MSKHTISVGLSENSISAAICELERFHTGFRKNVDIFRQRIADEIGRQAEFNLNSAVVDDIIIGGTPRIAQFRITVSDNGDVTVVAAEGADVVWCEFGAGVYHNGAAGSSPHPKGNELKLTIGSYGKGYGKRDAWGYYDKDKKLVISRGTPSTMPLYRAVQSVCARIIDIAEEVFA